MVKYLAVFFRGSCGYQGGGRVGKTQAQGIRLGVDDYNLPTMASIYMIYSIYFRGIPGPLTVESEGL